MKKIFLKSFAVFLMLISACSDSYFEKLPPSSATGPAFYNQEGIELLLIGAYSLLDGVGATPNGNRDKGNPYLLGGAASNWMTSDVRAGDVIKGSSAFDIAEGFLIERHEYLGNNPIIIAKWEVCFDGVSRCNDVIRAIENTKDVSQEFLDTKSAEARFLRAHYYSELKRVYNNVPWIDETTTEFRQPNDVDIWPNIETDFKFAIDHLPVNQSQVGRVTKGAAKAYLAKTYLFQKKFTDAKTVLDEFISEAESSGRYALNDCFRDNFDLATKNSKESIFAAQNIISDGSPSSDNGNWGDVLNQPLLVEGECCGFGRPSYDLVNAFQTDASGLPLLDTYQNTEVVNDYYPTPKGAADPFTPHTGPLDPRLDWTVGRRGIPYLDYGIHPGETWTNNRDYGGPYTVKKNSISKATKEQPVGSWAQGADASMVNLIRYAEVLLWAAEVEVEIGSLDQALTYVNRIRNRAKNGCWVMNGAVPAANYVIEPYGSFPNKDYARKAVRFERRLELAMEGQRFFDLVRWEVAKEVVDKYLAKETIKRPALAGAFFTAAKNEYFPLPEQEIINSTKDGAPVLRQNPGY